MRIAFFFLSITLRLVVFAQYVENDSTFNTVDTGYGRGDGANGAIKTTICQPDGKILIAGDFTTYNGIFVNRIARLLANGLLDPTFNVGSGASSMINCMALQPDGKILVAGNFYTFNGNSAENIVRLNTNGTVDPTFVPGIIANGSIDDLVIRPNGKIVIAGFFALSALNNSARLAQLNTDGTIDLSFANGFWVNDPIFCLKLQPDGKLLLGGNFTALYFSSINRLARLNVNGSLDATFITGLGANSSVTSIDLQTNGKILIAGSFTSINTTMINNLARLNSNGTVDTTFNHNLINSGNNGFSYGRPSFVVQPDGKIVIGGAISIPGNTNNQNVFRLESNGQLDASFAVSASYRGAIFSKLTLQSDGKILFAGIFHDFNDTIVNSLGRLNTNGTLDYFNLPDGTGANASYWGFGFGWTWGWWGGNGLFNYRIVNSIAIQPDGKILVGGTFGYFNGKSKKGLTRLHYDGSLDTNFNCQFNGVCLVNSIVLQPDGKILVGGNFQSVNGIPCNNLVRINANGSVDTTFQCSNLQSIEAIALQADGKIVIGQSWGASNIVLRLHSNGNVDTTFNTSAAISSWGNVNDIEIQPDGKIIIVGNIQSAVNNSTFPNIARLNVNGSLDLTFNPGLGADNEIKEMILQPDGKIVIIGAFNTIDGISKKSMARLNSIGSLDPTFDVGLGVNNNWQPIECAALQPDGKILIGGNFSNFNGISRNNFARVNADGSLDTNFVIGLGFNSNVYATAIQADGKILVGGDFTRYNENGRNRLARIISELPDASVSLQSLSGQNVCENRVLSLTFTIENTFAEGPLPVGTPVSFFVNDSLFLSTIFTSDSISIGDSMTLSTAVFIPPFVSSPFNLSIIANQDSTQLGVVGEINLSNNSLDTIISLTEIFIPTFDSVAPVCQGTNVVLPTTSTNGLVGTWSPAFNNQATTTYLFIPTDTNCIDSVLLTVQIVPSTLPTFTLADSICVNETFVFPTVSSNGVIGSWSPVFDNQNSETYTFFPDSVNVVAEGCPISTQHAVVIVPQTVPSFSFVDSLCIGSSFVLPTQADNGILGTWSVPFNNQLSTTYTFSPDTNTVFNGCAATVNQSIAIIPTLTPTFTIADSMCADVIYFFPVSSNENVLGSWSPVFDNQATQTYSFAPSSSGIVNTTVGARCPLSTSQTVTIVPRATPTFTILDSICVGASLVLPATSDNSITGTWSPAFNNQMTTTYTFVPTTISIATGCPETAQETVVVDPFVDPIFTSIDSICQGNIVVLPTTSENFINGSWSPAFDNQVTTTYTFTPSDPGCISTAQMTVPVFPLITPSFSIADSICQGDTLIFPTTSDNSISGTWSPALNNQQTTTYTFTPNANECAVSTQITVEVAPRITPDFSLPDTICQSEMMVLPLVSDNAITGTWSPIFNNQQTTNYTFIRNSYECASDVNYTLVVLPTSLTFDTLIYCENDLPFTWHGQLLSSSIDTTTTLQDQYGCDSIVNLSFQVLPILYSNFSAEICANDLPFIWAGQSYNQTGSYNQTFIAQSSCDSIVTLNLTVRPAPVVDFSMQPWTGCLPLEVTFMNNQVAAGTSYFWNFGNGQTSAEIQQVAVVFTQAGCYDVQLTATNEFECTSIQNQFSFVCIDPNPIAAFSPQINPLPLVNPTTLLQNNSVDAYTYFWDFGDGNQDANVYSPQHTFPEQAGSYPVTLLIENENGCKDSMTQTIFVEQDPLFYVPNAFTPDGNEFNNEFRPVFVDNLVLSQFEMKIYNRWGELVFLSQDPNMGWDGTFGGKQAQDGVYTYRILFKEKGFSIDFQAVGSVVLVR